MFKFEVGSKIIGTERNMLTEEFCLSPIQKVFFDENYTNIHHFNQSVLLNVNSKINLQFLKSIFSVIGRYHDVFRMEFTRDGFQKYTTTSRIAVDYRKIADVASMRQEVEEDVNLIQPTLNIFDGPLCRAVLYEAENLKKLLVVAHHLIIDGVSWRLLIDDLESIYHSFVDSGRIVLPPKSFSYKQWVEALEKSVQKFENEITYWNSVQSNIRKSSIIDPPLNSDKTEVKKLVLELDEDTSRTLVQNIPAQLNVHVNSIFLSALVLAVGDITSNYHLGFALEGHGREDIIGLDVSRTIGWFTSIFPVFLEISCINDLEKSIVDVDKSLKQIPNKGIGFGILGRWTDKIDAAIPPISFNYLGQWNVLESSETVFSYSDWSSGTDVDPKNGQQSSIDINCEIKCNRFTSYISYKSSDCDDFFMMKLSDRFNKRLCQIAKLANGR